MWYVIEDDIDVQAGGFGHVTPGVVYDQRNMMMLVYEVGDVKATCFLEEEEARSYALTVHGV